MDALLKVSADSEVHKGIIPIPIDMLKIGITDSVEKAKEQNDHEFLRDF